MVLFIKQINSGLIVLQKCFHVLNLPPGFVDKTQPASVKHIGVNVFSDYGPFTIIHWSDQEQADSARILPAKIVVSRC